MPAKADPTRVQVFAHVAQSDHLKLKSLAIGSGRSLHRTVEDILSEAVKDVQIPEDWIQEKFSVHANPNQGSQSCHPKA